MLSEAGEIKSCCASVYQSDWARLLLGDSFHPGGIALTEHLGTVLHLKPGQRILDVASGQGMSAIRLAQCFGCTVVGVEYSHTMVEKANHAAAAASVTHLVSFQQGDAEHLSLAGNSFDAVICECAFCTFPNKTTAMSEFVRVLKPGGYIGMSDLTRNGEVPEDLQSLLAWIACIADAQPVASYLQYFTEAGLLIDQVEPHDHALASLVQEIQGKILGAELLVKLKKIALPPNIAFDQARVLAKSAVEAVREQRFGYVIITAVKPE
jgi:ubiquinone/menaquinone biosynthesis C-methylase UbiE